MWCTGVPNMSLREPLSRRDAYVDQRNTLGGSRRTVFAGNTTQMASTLVETVSINYEDFSEYFLTCGTCLCNYDGAQHTPKLLPCSHTVCLHCLSRIVSSPAHTTSAPSTTDVNGPHVPHSFRCPICRENIRIPTGGVSALPPSFLVNQLLDLMSTQRREVVPKCSQHVNQELMFCESCDLVFCLMCSGGVAPHTYTSGTSDGHSQHHTVVPLAVAVKRMSEILCYKANECYSKLNEATENVCHELSQLETSVSAALTDIDEDFASLTAIVEQRRQEIVAAVHAIKSAKSTLLSEQLEMLEKERARISKECEGLRYQVEVQTITSKISDLNDKMDGLSALKEPRENSYLRFDRSQCTSAPSLSSVVQQYGRVATSRTLPSLSKLTLDMNAGNKPVTNIKTSCMLQTLDYTGNLQRTGGDPVEAVVVFEGQTTVCDVVDNCDGRYTISFTPAHTGPHTVNATIFGRSVGAGTVVEVCGTHNPHTVFGSKGVGPENLSQPAAIAISYSRFTCSSDKVTASPSKNRSDKCSDVASIYVADTGNSRIKILDECLGLKHHIIGEPFSGRSVTGLAVTANNTIMIVNWRTKAVTELTTNGQVVKQFTHPQLQEPTALTVTDDGLIIIIDGFRLLVFDYTHSHSPLQNSPRHALPSGKLLYCWGTKGVTDGKLGHITALCCIPNEEVDDKLETKEVVLADSRLQAFTINGDFVRCIHKPATKGGSYGGVTLDQNGLLLASRQEKGVACVQVFDYSLGTLIFTIDSSESKLKRPAGLVTTRDGWLLVLDIGGCCVKRFRYR